METDFPQSSPLCARTQSPLRKSRVHPISICQRQGTTTNRAPIFTYKSWTASSLSGLVNVAVRWHSPNLGTPRESVAMTKARPIALWWCSFCPLPPPANDHLSIGLLPEIDHAVCLTAFGLWLFQNRETSQEFLSIFRCWDATFNQLID